MYYSRSNTSIYPLALGSTMRTYGSDNLLGNRATVLRSHHPSNVTRRERYTRSLSNSTIDYNPSSYDPRTLSKPSYYLPGNANSSNNRRLSLLSRDTPSKSSYALLSSKSSMMPRRWWRTETLGSKLCTPDQLLDIIREPSGYYALPCDPYNEVYPGVYLSDAPTAMCTALLKRLGVTHVLNAAQGKMRRAGLVNTWPGFYSHSGIKFHGVEAFDNIVFRLYPYFEEAAEFMDDALTNHGKVLVHCRAGISRSATLVCAFLMLKRNMSVQEAVKSVRKNRAIIPNDGFLQQLCDLNEKLSLSPKNGTII